MKDYNVTMEMFVREPDGYVQDQRLVEEILNLTAYQALEAITKPLHEGVLSLSGNVGIMKEKDTITPLARGTPNGVLTQVPTEAGREAEERLRRTQEMKFTISTNIEDVLFRGRVRVNEMTLNDFLTRELDGRGIVDTNRDFLLEEFFKDPENYICDTGVLKEMQATGAYATIERAVSEEMDLEEGIRRLHKNGVDNLLTWSEAAPEVKASARDNNKNSLDAAAEEARKPTTTSAPEKLKGCYEFVCNARWHHVVKVVGGEGTRMEVEKGNHRSHGRTGQLATPWKRMTMCSNPMKYLPC
ncbi:retrotransposon hot spot (RHS) protein [Trypanosoma cruzi]|nr:retrotransposon hot spot (RHS) protein [Trypanosoma cruzi]